MSTQTYDVWKIKDNKNMKFFDMYSKTSLIWTVFSKSCLIRSISAVLYLAMYQWIIWSSGQHQFDSFKSFRCSVPIPHRDFATKPRERQPLSAIRYCAVAILMSGSWSTPIFILPAQKINSKKTKVVSSTEMFWRCSIAFTPFNGERAW